MYTYKYKGIRTKLTKLIFSAKTPSGYFFIQIYCCHKCFFKAFHCDFGIDLMGAGCACRIF